MTRLFRYWTLNWANNVVFLYYASCLSAYLHWPKAISFLGFCVSEIRTWLSLYSCQCGQRWAFCVILSYQYVESLIAQQAWQLSLSIGGLSPKKHLPRLLFPGGHCAGCIPISNWFAVPTFRITGLACFDNLITTSSVCHLVYFPQRELFLRHIGDDLKQIGPAYYHLLRRYDNNCKLAGRQRQSKT